VRRLTSAMRPAAGVQAKRGAEAAVQHIQVAPHGELLVCRGAHGPCDLSARPRAGPPSRRAHVSPQRLGREAHRGARALPGRAAVWLRRRRFPHRAQHAGATRPVLPPGAALEVAHTAHVAPPAPTPRRAGGWPSSRACL
jgi:hypothetical protein